MLSLKALVSKFRSGGRKFTASTMVVLRLLSDDRKFSIRCSDAKKGQFHLQLFNRNGQEDTVGIHFHYISKFKTAGSTIVSTNPIIDNGFDISCPTKEDINQFPNYVENMRHYLMDSRTKYTEADFCREFKETFKCDDGPAIEFIKFFRNWCASNRENDEKYFAFKLAECLLVPLIPTIPASCICASTSNDPNSNINNPVNLLWEAFKQFQFTRVLHPLSKTNENLLKIIWNETRNEHTLNENMKTVNNVAITDKLRKPNKISAIDGIARFCASDALLLPVVIDLTKMNDREIWNQIEKLFRSANSSKRFILFGEGQVESTRGAWNNLLDLRKSNQQLYENIINTFTLRFFGKHYSLNELLNSVKGMHEAFTPTHLITLADGTVNIGNEEPPKGPANIRVNFNMPCIDFEFLRELHEGKIEDTLVMVVCDNKSDMKKLKRNLIGVFSNQSSECKQRCQIMLRNDRDPEVAFDKLARKNHKDKCHLLQFSERDNCLIWIKSTRSVEDLQSHRLKQDLIKDQDIFPFLTNKQKINILCGAPGEEMNSFSTQLANIYDSPNFILRLRFHHYAFLPLFQGNPDLISFLRHIAKRIYGTDYLLLLDLFDVFLNENKIILVWEDLGDDPFGERNREYILRAIEEFRRRDITQWIITPACLRYELETRFNALAIHCEPFISQDHIGFLPFSSSENAEEKHSHCGSTPQLLERYDSYLKEKIRGNNSNSHSNEDQLLKNYEKAALKRSLEKSLVNEIPSEDEEQTFIESIVKRGDKCGVIRKVTSSYIPIFEHRSISDYLTACYLAKNRDNIKNLDFLFQPRYRRIRFFFDLKQAKELPLHTAILYQDKEMIQKCSQTDWKKRDRKCRTPLALAASWGKSHPKVQISTTATNDITITHVEDEQSYLDPQNEIVELLLQKPNLDSEINEALELADKSTSLSVINTILKYKPRKFTFKNMDIYTVIYYSIRYGYSSIIDNLDSVPELNTIKTRGGDSLWHLAAFYGKVNFFQRFGTPEIHNKFGETPIHIATKRGHLNIVKFLHNNQININIPDKNGQTPLSIASGRGHLDIVQYLIQNIPRKTFKDKQQLELPLLNACEHGHQHIVDELINLMESLNDEIVYKCLNKAALNNHREVITLLLQECSSQDAENTLTIPLQAAVEEGHLEIVKSLLEREANINTKSHLGNTLVCGASKHGHLDIVKYLVERGADINEVDKEGRTCLWWAACGGHLDVVEHLVLQGNADADRRDKNDCSPLWIASKQGHLEVVKFLVDKGCDVNCRNKFGDTPFKSACQSGHLEVAKYLQKTGANIMEEDAEGCDGLWRAAHEGHLDIVEYLIHEGVNTKRENQNGLRPLHAAAQREHLDIFKLLTKDQEEAIHATTGAGKTPLHLAAQNGRLDVVKYLKKINAAIDFPDHNGSTPLHLACFYGQLPVVKYLAGCGANINTPASDLSTPISVAASHGYLEIVTFLAKEKVFLNPRDLNRATPIQLAARKGYYKIVKYLLSQKVNRDSADIFGRTALWEAADNNHLEIVKLLASHGSYINSTTQNGFTPIHAATRRCNLGMVRWLLDNGADPQVRDIHGWNISCTAMLLGHNDLLDVFKDRNIDIYNNDGCAELPLDELNVLLNDGLFEEL